jgi:predicted signal transduction protein with EAL and GGDEF domain
LHVGIAISASSGAAFFPEDSRSSEALLDIADRRMYLNKRSRSTQSFLTGDLPKSELSEAS